jgi:hypothetical protein
MGYEIRILERIFCTPDDPLWIVNNIGKLQYMPDTHSWLLHRVGESGMWVKVPDAKPAKNLRLLLKIAITWFWR